MPLEHDLSNESLKSPKIINDHLLYIIDEEVSDFNDPNFGLIESKVVIVPFENQCSNEYVVTSHRDSIAKIFIRIVEYESDSLYILQMQRFQGELTLKLIETDYQFSFINEYELPIPFNGDDWFTTSTALIHRGQLLISTHSFNINVVVHNLHFDQFSWQFSGDFPETDINKYYGVSAVNDSLLLRVSNEIIFHYDTLGIVIDSFAFAGKGQTGYQNPIYSGESYSAGVRYNSTDPFDTREIFIVDRYNPNSMELITVFADTLQDGNSVRAFENVDLSSDGTIYATLNTRDGCSSGLCGCESSFKVYSLLPSGELNWSYDIGSEDCSFLEWMIATPDGGVLLFSRNYSNSSNIPNSDVYWIKLNKDGSQDYDFFDCNENGIFPAVLNRLNIELQSNPVHNHATYEFAEPLGDFTIRIFDQVGRVVKEEYVESKVLSRQISVWGFASGVYPWVIIRGNDSNILGNGKLVVY